MCAEIPVLVIQLSSSESKIQANSSSSFTLSLDRIKRELGFGFILRLTKCDLNS